MFNLPCDIVILPSTELATKAIEASKKLEQYKGFFTLEDGRFFPHSSLYMLQLQEDDLEKVESLLSQIAGRTKLLHLKPKGYCQKENFIDVEYSVSEELAKLQSEVISALNTIRDGIREKDKARMQEAIGLALENYQKYGYKNIGELFRPHITFTRFTEPQIDAESLLPLASEFTGDFPKIGLFEMGDNGTCIRKIAEFDLTTS